MVPLLNAGFFLTLPLLILWWAFYRFHQKQSNAAPPPWRMYGCAGSYFGAVCGGIGGLILPPFYYQLTQPEILQDGQWGMIYLLTLPAGIAAGVIIGISIALGWRNAQK